MRCNLRCRGLHCSTTCLAKQSAVQGHPLIQHRQAHAVVRGPPLLKHRDVQSAAPGAPTGQTSPSAICGSGASTAQASRSAICGKLISSKVARPDRPTAPTLTGATVQKRPAGNGQQRTYTCDQPGMHLHPSSRNPARKIARHEPPVRPRAPPGRPSQQERPGRHPMHHPQSLLEDLVHLTGGGLRGWALDRSDLRSFTTPAAHSNLRF